MKSFLLFVFVLCTVSIKHICANQDDFEKNEFDIEDRELESQRVVASSPASEESQPVSKNWVTGYAPETSYKINSDARRYLSDLDPVTTKYNIAEKTYLNFTLDCGNGLTIYAGRFFERHETYSEFEHWKCESKVEPPFFLLSQKWMHSKVGMIAQQDEKFELLSGGFVLMEFNLRCWHFCQPGTKNITLFPSGDKTDFYSYDEKGGRQNNYHHEFYYLNRSALLEKYPALRDIVTEKLVSSRDSAMYDIAHTLYVNSYLLHLVLFIFIITFV